jgi:ATP-binding cassette subfamily B protein
MEVFSLYRFRTALVFTAILLTSLLGLVNPILIAHVFDDAVQHGNASLLLIFVAVMVTTAVIVGIIGVGQTYLNNAISLNITRDFRNLFYQRFQSMPLHFFTERRIAEVQSRVSNDVGGVQVIVTNTAPNLISNILVVLSTIVVMIFLSPLLTLIMLVLLPPFLWLAYKVGNARRRMSKETQESTASLTALIQETFSWNEVLLIKVFGRQKYAEAQFTQANQKVSQLALPRHMLGRWIFMSIGMFFTIIPALVYLVAGEQIIHHIPVLGSSVTLGVMVAFTALQFKLFFSAGQIMSMQADIREMLAIFDRIFEYLDMPVGITDKPDAHQITPEKILGTLSFDNVNFVYKADEYGALNGTNEGEQQDKSRAKRPNSLKPLSSSLIEETHPILRNISFNVKPGQLVALVGASGSGKTMLTYMVPRLYDADTGTVEIDGINVKDIALASLGRLVGVVTQETPLFYASIRENILYARPDATEEEMIAAAQTAAIHDRIMELADGYNTIVGERGFRLSSDEKQRLAIARVVLKNPPFLVLNEAINAPDAQKRLTQDAMRTVMKGRTTLVIAYRLSTLLAADMILVMDKGKIVERGTHRQLLALGGLYARQYRQQSEAKNTTATLAVPNPQARPRASLKQYLIVVSPTLDEVREVILEKEVVTLGEAATNDIVLNNDYQTSPYHALLRKHGDGYYLLEKHSENGVFVNGERLVAGTGHKLADGDQIIIGRYRLIFSCKSDQNQANQVMSVSPSKEGCIAPKVK